MQTAVPKVTGNKSENDDFTTGTDSALTERRQQQTTTQQQQISTTQQQQQQQVTQQTDSCDGSAIVDDGGTSSHSFKLKCCLEYRVTRKRIASQNLMKIDAILVLLRKDLRRQQNEIDKSATRTASDGDPDLSSAIAEILVGIPSNDNTMSTQRSGKEQGCYHAATKVSTLKTDYAKLSEEYGSSVCSPLLPGI
jgi:hypothetical protein